MSLDTRALLEELSGIGFGVDEDDPIAQVALAQAAATEAADRADVDVPETGGPLVSATPRRWRGSKLLRDAARASSTTTPERSSEESADALAEAAVEAAEPYEDDAEADEDLEDSPTVLELLTDVRALLQQQVRLLSKLVDGRAGTTGVMRQRSRSRSRAEAAPEVTADAVITPDAEPAVEDPSVPAQTRQEQLQAALASRAARRQERAARERQQLSDLIAQGLSSEDAMLRIEAERSAHEEACEEAEEAAEDAVLDDVPMAASGAPELDDDVQRREPRVDSAKGSRSESFDVDFDVSALSAKDR
jgi:hypothetical protein